VRAPIGAVRAQNQTPKSVAARSRINVAADDEIFASLAFDLDPVVTAAGLVSAIRPFRHGALESHVPTLLEELWSAPFDMLNILHPRRRPFEDRGEQPLPVDKGTWPQIVAVEVQQIKNRVHELICRALAKGALQRAEITDAITLAD
jgi:hypothetical protein